MGMPVALTVIISNIGKFEVLLKIGSTSIAVAALRTAETTPVCLPCQVIEAGLAEVVAAWK